MKKIRHIISRPAAIAVMFIAALALLFGGSIGTLSAALSGESEYYSTQAETSHIGIALTEEGEEVKDGGTLLSGLLERSGDTKLHAGKRYEETLAVKNTGAIDEYVRVTVYKYWIDEKGDKFPEMDSAWIDLGFTEGKGWSVDADASTEERTVLYYAEELKPGETSEPFMDSVRIDDAATRKVTQTVSERNGVTVITTTYDYNGKSFMIEVSADGVQTHSGDKARSSAWGVYK